MFQLGSRFKFTVEKAYYRALTKAERNSSKCCICFNEEKNVVFFPCQHKFVGINCVEQKKVWYCPECFQPVQNYMRIFN